MIPMKQLNGSLLIMTFQSGILIRCYPVGVFVGVVIIYFIDADCRVHYAEC